MAVVRSRSYCFTLNNYTFDDLMEFLDIVCKYKCVGFEEGELGTPHLQGYIQFHDAVRFSTLKKKLTRAHLIVARGTPQQNISYCSKEGLDDFYEFGDPPTTGGSVRKKPLHQIMGELKDPMNNLSTVRYYGNTVRMALQMHIKQVQRVTEFFVCTPIADAITEIMNVFPGVQDWVIVEELQELAFYEDPQYIIYMPSPYCATSMDSKNLWPRGKPILYKAGYEYRVAKPDVFVLVSDSPQFYPLYKRI